VERTPRLTNWTTGDDQVLVVAIAGGVDLSNTYHVNGAVLGEAVRTTRGVVLDLTETDYLDSSGVHLIIGLQRRLRSRRQALSVVVQPDSIVEEVVQVTDLSSLVPIHTDVDSAVAGLLSTPPPV